jgi:hypothetical protein
VNASGHSDVCVCVCDGQATGLQTARYSRGDIRVEAPPGEVFYPLQGGVRGQVEHESTFQCRCSKGETCCIINEHRRHQGRRELFEHVSRCNIIVCAGILDIVLRPSAFSSFICGRRFFTTSRFNKDLILVKIK